MVYVFYALGTMVIIGAVMVAIVARRPSDFRVSRSLLILATRETLFPYFNNLKRFQDWNPYKDKDPTARNEFSGPEEGPGAVFRWSGNGNVGEGSMTIATCQPYSRVNVDLEFIRPFKGKNVVEFALASQSDGTMVTWSMVGKNALIPKIMGLFINMDKMIGGDFEIGLGRLKSLVESHA